jgi:predicted 2-oxoglutarate/Fe(II)-dependent dioxygenase YbiX
VPEARAALIVDRAQTAELHADFEEKVRIAIRPLIRNLWGVDLPDCNGTQLVRYITGGYFVPHQDSDEAEFASRYFTVLCYLNNDFEGGNTIFPSLKCNMRSYPGKAMIFPSQYLHAAEPVTRGEKFIFVTWMCGPVPIKWI